MAKKPIASQLPEDLSTANDESQLDSPEKYYVPATVRTLQILELLAKHPHDCGITEVAERLSLPKNSVFRILTTLADYGYLRRDPERKVYGLTRKLLTVGYAAIDEINLVERSLQAMRRLRDLTRETVAIGTLSGTQGIVLEQVLGKHPIKVTLEIGHCFPLHTAAPGKVLLAFLPSDERDSIISKMTFRAFTDRSITNRDDYLKELDCVLEVGYALDRGEEVEDIICIAAPILSHRAKPVAAIWMTSPRSRLARKDFTRVGRVVMEQAFSISEQLGYQKVQRDS